MNIEEAIDILVPKQNIDLSNHFNNTRFFEAIYTLLIAYEKEKRENVKLRLQDIPLIEGELKAYKDRVNELKQELEKEKEMKLLRQVIKKQSKEIEEYKEKCKNCNFKGKVCDDFIKNYECTIGVCLKEFYSLLEKE